MKITPATIAVFATLNLRSNPVESRITNPVMQTPTDYNPLIEVFEQSSPRSFGDYKDESSQIPPNQKQSKIEIKIMALSKEGKHEEMIDAVNEHLESVKKDKGLLSEKVKSGIEKLLAVKEITEKEIEKKKEGQLPLPSNPQEGTTPMPNSEGLKQVLKRRSEEGKRRRDSKDIVLNYGR